MTRQSPSGSWPALNARNAARVTSFRALPSEGMAPRFLIGLHIINPNREAISLQGITYRVSLEGRKLLNGVANDLPEVPA
jgi:hypothetical protein